MLHLTFNTPLIHIFATYEEHFVWFSVYSCVLLTCDAAQQRNVGVSPPPKPPRIWSAELCGTGMVMVMGLWNFLLRGSRVTIGLNVAFITQILPHFINTHWLSLAKNQRQ